MRPWHGGLRWIASPLLWPFVLLYAMGVRLKNAAYDHRLFKLQRLSWPVLSIGNLSVGGTGKTPMVLLLADLLEKCGWSVDVLSRGYGRSSQRVAWVDPNGTAGEFGDEPLLMARRGISVYVGTDRYQPGMVAEKDAGEGSRRLHILDDGLQHRRLTRAVNIVLLQRTDLEDQMLPLGRLREPLSALERADLCVLRAEDADLAGRVLRLMRRDDPARIWFVERRTVLPTFSRRIPKALAFCAIGDPCGFFEGLCQVGIDVQAEIAFRDHHIYTHADIERLQSAAQNSGAECFITTEKDQVRLGDGLRAELEKERPLIVAGLEISLREEARSMATLDALITGSLQVHQHNVR